MKHQRVLYAKIFTTELKSKLRIVSYDKRRSSKGNVYYVTFASDADMEYADRVSKHLHDVTLKPFQSRFTYEAQRENRMSLCSDRESLASSSVPRSSSPIPFLLPPAILSFLPDYRSAFITSKLGSSQQGNETVEEHALRVLGSSIASSQSVIPTPILQASNLDKKQLIDGVQSCLSVMETARRAANELCQLHRRGIDCRVALNHLFKVHSTAFYLKAATSAQIKAAFYAGLRLSWSDVANSINVLKNDIRHEQLFMTQLTSAKYILTKIDSATSIAMSSKLAYQLTKLSH